MANKERYPLPWVVQQFHCAAVEQRVAFLHQLGRLLDHNGGLHLPPFACIRDIKHESYLNAPATWFCQSRATGKIHVMPVIAATVIVHNESLDPAQRPNDDGIRSRVTPAMNLETDALDLQVRVASRKLL